jgi:hypothetical protein
VKCIFSSIEKNINKLLKNKIMKKLCWTTIDENILNEAKRTGFRLNELLILGLKEVKKMGKNERGVDLDWMRKESSIRMWLMKLRGWLKKL